MRYQLPALLLLAIFVLLMQNPTPWAQSHALHTETADPPWDPFAPSALQQLNCNPSQPASCRYAAQVELAPRTPPGFWGMKIDLASPTNLFEGGIDFGGALAANALKEAYLRFRIDNPQQQPQIVVLEIEAQFTRADFPSRLGIEAQLFSLQAGETRIPAGERLRSTPGSAANLQWLRTSALLIPGDYLLVLNTAAGSAWATFQAQMQTRLASGFGGGFAGSVETGGYLNYNRMGESLVGYAAFSVGQAQAVRFQTMRREYIGALLLRIVDSAGNTIYDSVTAPTTTTTTVFTTTTTLPSFSMDRVAFGNLDVSFSPNPVMDTGGGVHLYDILVQETNGTAVELSRLAVGGSEKDIYSFLGSRHLDPYGVLRGRVQYTAMPPLSEPRERLWEITGADNQGHLGLTWRGSVRMIPAKSTPYAHLQISFLPNPALPDGKGERPFTLTLRETNGVGVTLKEVSYNNQPIRDFASMLGGGRIPPKGTFSGDLKWLADSKPGIVTWLFKGDDDNRHTDLTWEAEERLSEYYPLLDGEWQEHESHNRGLMPFQYTTFVPGNATGMTLQIDSGLSFAAEARQESSTPGSLSVYIRAGKPVEDLLGLGILVTADRTLTNVSSGTLSIGGRELKQGETYYIAISSSAYGTTIPYKLQVTYTLSSASTTSTTQTPLTTITIRPTTTTVKATTTTTKPSGSTTTSTIPAGKSTASGSVSSSSGGVIGSDDNHQVIVPAGAVPTTSGTLAFTVKTNVTPPTPLPASFKPLSKVVHFGPDNIQFSKAVQTNIPMPANTDFSNLIVARYDSSKKGWYAYPFTHPEGKHNVVSTSDRRLGYQVVGVRPGGSTTSAAEGLSPAEAEQGSEADGAFWWSRYSIGYNNGTLCPDPSPRGCWYRFVIKSARLKSDPTNPNPYHYYPDKDGTWAWIPMIGSDMATGTDPLGNPWNDKSIFHLPLGTYTMCIEAQESTGRLSEPGKWWVSKQYPVLTLTEPYHCYYSFCTGLLDWGPQVQFEGVGPKTIVCDTDSDIILDLLDIHFEGTLVNTAVSETCHDARLPMKIPLEFNKLKWSGNNFQAVISYTDDYGFYKWEYKISGTLSADRKSITAINLSTLDSGPGYSHTRTLKAKNLPLDSKTKSNDSYSYYLEGTDLAASITEATFNPKFMTPYYPNSNCVYSSVDYTVKASLRVNLEKAKSSTKELFEK